MKSKKSDSRVGHYVITRSRSRLLARIGGDCGSSFPKPDINLAFEDEGNTCNSNCNHNHSMLKKKKCGACLGQGVLKRHKSSSISTTAFVPNDILFHILVLLPADVLYNVMRCVCWSWYRLIADPVFVREHLHRQSQCSSSFPSFLGMAYPTYNFRVHVELKNAGRDHIQVSESSLPFVSDVRAIRDGLVILDNLRWMSRTDQRILSLANPVTGEKLALPPFNNGTPRRSFTCSIAYAPSIACYKVFLVTFHNKLLVLTPGIDSSWRVIDPKNVPIATYFRQDLTIDHCFHGHLYWFGPTYPTSILVLDVDSETVGTIPTPLDKSSLCRAQVMNVNNRWLGLLDFKYNTYGEVWALTCFEQVNWTKMFNLQMDTLSRHISPLYFNWVKTQLIYCSSAGDVVFKVHGRSLSFVWHHVKTGDFKVYETEELKFYPFNFLEHVNSLISPMNRI